MGMTVTQNDSPLDKLREDLTKRPVRETLEPVKRWATTITNGSTPTEVVQIVGSNGKGSVVHYTESVLADSPITVVSYTSPHLIDVVERLRIDAEPIDAEKLNRLLGDLPESCRKDSTPFERLFLTAILLAEESGADVLLLEAGMGGRWDATSVLPADWTVLTSVDSEHTEILGETRRQILREQTQQIPSGSGLISKDFSDEVLNQYLSAQQKDNSLTGIRVNGELNPDQCNRRLALVTSRVISELSATHIDQLLRCTKRPTGRKDVRKLKDREIILDVAHSPRAIKEWLAFSERNGSDTVCYIFGCLEGKEIDRILSVLQETIDSDRLIMTRPPSTRALSPEDLVDRWPQSGSNPGIIRNPDKALERAMESTESGGKISVGGSFKMVGYYLKEWLDG